MGNCVERIMSTGNPRNKVALKPGFSQLHWMMKVQSDRNISGRGGKPPRGIRMEEVALHASEDDAWTVFRGRVFNITPYLHYHPGGVEILMQGAGKDCTELFNLYHQWVNAEGMIGALYLGDLIEDPPVTSQSKPTTTMAPPTSSSSNLPNKVDNSSTAVADVSDETTATDSLQWVDVADAVALTEEDSRLLVQVPSPQQSLPVPAGSGGSGGGGGSGRWVALIRCDGELHAIDATCYHMGGPLLFADIEDLNVKLNKQEQKSSSSGGSSSSKLKKEACLNCPWHHYKIRLSDGHRLHLVSGNKYEASEEPKQRKHLVKEENGRIFVHLMEGLGANEGLKEIASDGYAFKKPAPAQKGSKSNRRSGNVLSSGNVVVKKSVKAGILDSMKGSDGVAPWMMNSTTTTHATNAAAQMSEERTVIGYEFKSPSSRHTSSISMMLSSHFSVFLLASISQAGKDMMLMRFKCLPSLRSTLAFRGRHVDVRAELKYFYEGGGEDEEDDEVIRPYTPIIRPDEFGEFTLLVKGYEKGMLSKHLIQMKVGDGIEMRGPFGGIDVNWLDLQPPTIHHDEKKATKTNTASLSVAAASDDDPQRSLKLVLLGAGTGVTPCLQLIFGILSKLTSSGRGGVSKENANAVSDITLITFNRNEEDIPMKDELDALNSSPLKKMKEEGKDDSNDTQRRPNIKVVHVLSSHVKHEDGASSSWNGLTGRVSEELLLPYLLNSEEDKSIKQLRLGFCGPDGFHMTVRKIIEKLKIDPSSCHEFC